VSRVAYALSGTSSDSGSYYDLAIRNRSGFRGRTIPTLLDGVGERLRQIKRQHLRDADVAP